MTNQQRLEQIEQRLNKLDELNQKIDRIIAMLEQMATVNRHIEPEIQFSKANPNVDNRFIFERQKEIFSSLDGGK